MSKTIAAALAATMLCALPVCAGGAEIPADLAQAVRDYDQAQIKGDGAELKRLLADDYTLVNSKAQVDTKAGLIASYVDPDFRLDPYVVKDPIEKVWNDGAVMGGLVTLSGVDHGKRFSTVLHFADIWARRNGRWQVIFTEVTKGPQ